MLVNMNPNNPPDLSARNPTVHKRNYQSLSDDYYAQLYAHQQHQIHASQLQSQLQMQLLQSQLQPTPFHTDHSPYDALRTPVILHDDLLLQRCPKQNSKRQRRQTAGTLLSNLLKTNKPSTAQPRPEIQIPPRGIGPVYEPNRNDVLCGRGGRINAHAGNVQFRELVLARKVEYLHKNTKKLEKAHIAADVVHSIRCMDPGGRFLKEDADGTWYDIGDAKAIKKVGQALREDAPEVREVLEETVEKAPVTVSTTNGTGHTAVGIAQAENTRTATTHSPGSTVPVRGGARAGVSPPRPQQTLSNGNSTRNNPHRPIAVQALDSAASQYPQQIMPPPALVTSGPNSQNRLNLGLRGMMPKTAASSAATAAIVQDSDVAFGRTFHPADSGGSSMISGLSGPTNISGMSGISALTDPISALSSGTATGHGTGNTHASHEALRTSQLLAMRQQWAAQRAASTGTDVSKFRDSTGLGNSLNQPLHSASDLLASDSMSWAENSLTGGGIRDSASHVSGMSLAAYSAALQQDQVQQHFESLLPTSEGRVGGGGASTGSSSKDTTSSKSTNRMGTSGTYHPHQQHQPRVSSSGVSIASMSVASNAGMESLPSVEAGSVMSDISESLLALELAETNMLGDFEGME